MARKTKEQVILELKQRNIEFDPKAKYNALYTLLKLEEKKQADKLLHEIAKSVGFSEERIARFPTKEDLIRAVNRVKPNTIPLSNPTIEKPPKPEEKKMKEPEIKVLVLDLPLRSAEALGPMRVEHENRSVKAFLARSGIQGIRRRLTQVDIHRSYDKPYHTIVTVSYIERAE